MIQNVMTSAAGRVTLPDADCIGVPALRAEFDRMMATADKVQAADRINDMIDPATGAIKAGWNLPADMDAPTLAEHLTTSRDRDQVLAEARARWAAALGAHGAAWAKDAAARVDRAAAAYRKAAATAVAALNELERHAGVVEMLRRHPGLATWHTPPIGGAVHQAREALAAVTAELERQVPAERAA